MFLVIFLLSSQAGFSTVKSSAVAAASQVSSGLMHTATDPVATDMALPIMPATKPEKHAEKPHNPKLEEVAHIHHFHKERVKKMKRHHKKTWALSKLILVVCHIALLVMAYMHLTH